MKICQSLWISSYHLDKFRTDFDIEIDFGDENDQNNSNVQAFLKLNFKYQGFIIRQETKNYLFLLI
jgi:hypothetical protein